MYVRIFSGLAGDQTGVSRRTPHRSDPRDDRGASLYTRDDTARHLHRPAVGEELGFPRVNLVGVREDDSKQQWRRG